jgi:Protein of unknown function (DUF3089)
MRTIVPARPDPAAYRANVRRRASRLLLVGAALLAGCGGHSAPKPAAPSPATPTATGGGRTVWLCSPGATSDPCTGDLATTSVSADGSTAIDHPRVAPHPSIDCFYLYPTVSNEDRGNSDLRIQLPELVVAQAQAQRFSQVCRVFAPMYRQITDRGLTTPSLHASAIEAYDSVLSAWRDYLAHWNHGRGVVLIGHSQGAYVLKALVERVIDRNAAERRLLVSAILLGGQVLEADHPGVKGDFVHVPACASATQTGCVIAYSSFSTTPPAKARFGRDPSSETHVMCVNPAAPGSTKTVTVHPLFPTVLVRLMGGSLPKLSTPWVSFPGLYRASCERSGTASWLQITRITTPGDRRPGVEPEFGPGWGLHATDVNIALADLVRVVGDEAKAYTKR